MTFDVIKTLDQQLKRKGMLMIIWGWLMCVHYLLVYLLQIAYLSFELRDFLNLTAYALIPIGLLITVLYLYRQSDTERIKHQSIISYLWIVALISLVLVNLIQANVLNTINFDLQHPIFMVIMAMAITVTGKLMAFKPLMIGGILFGVFAYTASFFALADQLMIEALGWLVAFVIPGHLLYSRRGQTSYYRATPQL